MKDRQSNTPTPPKYFLRFLRWYCREDCIEEIEGDLLEIHSKMHAVSPSRADSRFKWQVVKHFRPAFIKKASIIRPHTSIAMFQNNLKIGWRSLTKQKFYASIKIGGFAFGITACLLMGLFIRQELSYDLHYKEGSQIYRVIRETNFNNELGKGAHFPSPFASALIENFPEIDAVGRYNATGQFGAGGNQVRSEENATSYHEDDIVFVDHDLLNILEVNFIEGNPYNALKTPNTVVITASKRQKYFKNEEAIGRVLFLNNDDSKPYVISGVIDDFEPTSHFQHNFMISLANHDFYNGESSNWQNDNYITYIKVKPATNIKALTSKFASLVKKYFLPPRIASGNAEGIAWVKSFRFKLQPIKDIYLNVDRIRDGGKHGDIRYIWLFSSISIFTLLIACVNFINLSTAKSADRAREVGLRKVVGSQKSSLIFRFLTESILLSTFAFIIGFMLTVLLLPYFNSMLNIELMMPWSIWWFFPSLVCCAILIGIISGIYPSFYLSSFQPIQMLKGKVSNGTKNSTLRNGLVIFQFVISIILIIGTLTVTRQMDFILNKKLGYNKDQVIMLQSTHTLGDRIKVFKQELKKIPQIEAVSITGYLPVAGTSRNNGGWYTPSMTEEDAISGQQWAVDDEYVNTLGLTIIKGRDFSIANPGDTKSLIINESLASALNLDDPIGHQLTNYLGTWTIVGVVKNFHFESLKKEIRPLGIYIRPNNNTVIAKINSSNMQETITAIAKIWKQFSPNQAIRYSFVDQEYAAMYTDVNRTNRILTIFTVMAIVIAGLGLFGLSSYLIEQRGKEISVRLVLGASVKSIFQLLTSNYVKLVLIAFVIATPIAWYMMTLWLQDYVYRIQLGWGIFMGTGLLSIAIALLTITYQSFQAATMKPVDKLRSD